ncbi:MAG: hypothetical protein RIA71_05895 [Oceanicaulis sp.]
MLTLAAAGVASLAMGQASGAPLWNSVQACVEEQAACANGACDTDALVRACRYDALDAHAAAVVRAEMRSVAAASMTAPSQACGDELYRRTETAVRSIEADGPLALSEPYAPTSGSSELASEVEAELFWRAQLDERLTGQAAARVRSEEESPCGVSPFADVVQLRAQNLAFAESVDALAMAQEGRLSAPAMWGVWFIYNHADLWQDEQADAAGLFVQLADDGRFANSLATGLDRRVAAHQPLYTADQLAGGWPD